MDQRKKNTSVTPNLTLMFQFIIQNDNLTLNAEISFLK